MKKKLPLFLTLNLFLLIWTTAQESPPVIKDVIKTNGVFLMHTFGEYTVMLAGPGIAYERKIDNKWSLEFAADFAMRLESPLVDMREYTDVKCFSVSGKRYFYQTFSGWYVGVGIDLGIPSYNATAGEFLFNLGYQWQQNHLIIDFNVLVGFGALRTTIHDYWGTYYESMWGFIVQPAIRAGYAF